LLWQREEALALISDVEIMYLPSSHVFDNIVHTFDSHSNFIVSFLSRIESHLEQVKVDFEVMNGVLPVIIGFSFGWERD
jgi:long-subunit acyl-CoA synthetase (AMP-forming)